MTESSDDYLTPEEKIEQLKAKLHKCPGYDANKCPGCGANLTGEQGCCDKCRSKPTGFIQLQDTQTLIGNITWTFAQLSNVF